MPSLTIAALTVLTMLAQAVQNTAPPARPLTGSISGRVIDAVSGKPIPGAVVFPNPMPRRDESGVTTDADGRYRLEGLAPRKQYILRAEHHAYAIGLMGFEQRAETRVPLEVIAGQHRTDVDISLAPAGRISGQITTEAGQPLAGVRVDAAAILVMAAIAERTISHHSAVTNDKGEYDLRVASGRYLIHGEVRGLKDTPPTDPTYYPGVTRRDAATAIEVSAGDRVGGVDFALVRSAARTIAGRVVGNTMLADEIRLTAANPSSGRLSRARARQDGTFTIFDVKPGRHLVWVRADLPDQIDVAFTTVDVTDDVADLPLILGPAGAIAGRVVTDDKTPAPEGICVIAALLDGVDEVDPTVPDQAEIDADGRFTIGGLFATRRLRLVKLPEGWSLKTILINGREASPPDVMVHAGATIDQVQIVITRQ